METTILPNSGARFGIVGVNYVDIYVKDYRAALDYYTEVFGPAEYIEGDDTHGWRLGRTWLTVFPAADGNPRNVCFSIEMTSTLEADKLHQAFIKAGGKGEAPRETRMYENMYYCPVEDPFGSRILVYCPVRTKQE